MLKANDYIGKNKAPIANIKLKDNNNH